MKIAVPKETQTGEKRVATVPDVVKKLVRLGFNVTVEAGAGSAAFYPDDSYREAGAEITSNSKILFEKAQLIFKVQAPHKEELKLMPKGATLIGLLGGKLADAKVYSSHKIHAYSLELLPRISRAQAMDVLSSQSTITGYWSVLEAAQHLPKLFPLLMTAAGTLKAAQVLVLGVGVAGLQAIATAKRLGAVVWAFDVRPETREQVESLGGKFVDIPLGDEGVGQGGYAKSLSEEAQKRQQSAIQALLPKIDVVITTALIPGKPAPKLMTPEMVACMKPGSLVIDLAAESGGNCAYAKAGEAVVKEGVTIIGASNAPSTFPQDSSHLYAHNLYHFITLLANKDQDTLASPESDELLKATYLG